MKRANFPNVAFVTLVALVAAIGVAAFLRMTANAENQQPSQSATQTTPATDGSRIEYGTLQSTALGRDLPFAVQLPPSYDKDAKRRYPVLYFLHGMNGNEREFEARHVADKVNQLRQSHVIGEMIIIAPQGKNSFYLNAKNGEQYEDAIIKDLVPYVEKTYRAVGTRDARAIQGISMGGFGALVLAFKHPEIFSSVTAHCAAIFSELPDVSGADRYSQFRRQLVGKIFGDPPDAEFFKANNPTDVATSNAASIKKTGLKIYFDVGEQDRYQFAAPNKTFDEHLTKLGIAHKFNLFQGNHGWEYMISVADNSYGFLWGNFKVGGKPLSAQSSK
ncbi:MAG: alpha/beta hydrolase family protein [Acidobacteriota bacterium]